MNRRQAVLALTTAASGVAKQRTGFAFREISPASLELTEDGRTVFAYNHGMMLKAGAPGKFRRSTYLHPVCAPSGIVLTDDFPVDHYHHRGISWMWPVVMVGGGKYDLWGIEGIRQQFVRWTAREAASPHARLGVENGWFIGERKVLKETVAITARPAVNGRRTLEFTLVFEAVAQPLQIAGTSDEQKGYGGFCFRFAPRKDTVIRTGSGIEARDTNLVPHPWAQLEGIFEKAKAGARIDSDRRNEGYPNGWCLRRYGFLGVNFPGLRMHTLQPGKPLNLRYAVTLF
jgi:hypothetical protein